MSLQDQYNEDGSPKNPINPDKYVELTTATAQEVFDASVEHLREQGCQSMDEAGDNCLYKGAGGEMCAAAIFIPNYTGDLEGKEWGGLISLDVVSSEHSLIVSNLQVLHDSLHVPKPYTIEQSFEGVAVKFNLEYKGSTNEV